MERVSAEFQARSHEPVPPTHLAAVSSIVRIHQPRTLRYEALLLELKEVPPESAVLIVDMARYRSTDVGPLGGLPLAEDRWVPPFHQCAVAVIGLAKAHPFYAVLDAGEFQPLRAQNQALLASIDDCGVITGRPVTDREAALAEQVARWPELRRTGKLGDIVDAADAIPGLTEQQQAFVKATALHYLGRSAEALAVIRPHLNAGMQDVDGDPALKLAVMLADGGDSSSAEALLARVVPRLEHEEQFRSVLALATRLQSASLIDAAAGALDRLYPHSPALVRHRIRLALNTRRYGDAAEMAKALDSTDGGTTEVEYYSRIALHLGGTTGPAYDRFLEDIMAAVPTQYERACLFCAQDALVLRRYDDSLTYAALVPPDSDLAPHAIDTALRALESLLLQRNPDGTPVISQDILLAYVSPLLVYLGRNPSDGASRVDLARLLSVQVAGTAGMSVLAILAVAAATRPVTSSGPAAGVILPEISEEFGQFSHAALEALAPNAPFILGLGELPLALSQVDADRYLPQVTALIQEVGHRLVDETDVRTLFLTLHFGMLLAKRATTPDEDLVLLRLAAAELAASGRAQHGRDIVESALQGVTAADSPHRRRLAWLAFADVYHRARNFSEALLGAVAFLSIEDATMTSEESWHEVLLLMRLFRDLGFPKFAREFLPTARSLLPVDRLGRTGAHRLDTMELGIRLKEILEEQPTVAADTWRQFLGDLSTNCEAVLRVEDEPAPVSSLLAQAIAQSAQAGVVADPSILETLRKALAELPPSVAARVRSICETTPTIADLLALLGGTEDARFADDIGTDLSPLMMVGKRLLGRDLSSTPSAAAFAIELMADHTFHAEQVSPGETERRSGSYLPKTAEDVTALLRALSMKDRLVHMIGLDNDSRLVRVTAHDGVVEPPVRESSDIFSPSAFDHWSQRYPYRYADLDTPIAIASNEARVSVMQIGLSDTRCASTIIVPTVELSALPANLLFLNDDFAGRQMPMASIPSLTWLGRVRQRHRDPTGRRVAWVSTRHHEDAPKTLLQLADRIREPLAEFHIDLHTNPSAPAELRGADLAIIGAHGGLVPEQRFFQVVADEHSLRLPARHLATLVADAGLVVLFICSAGRSDAVPFASATIGLAKLVLDAGARAVVASPWPLDARVPAHWLPAFLRASAKGATLIEATFLANQTVATSFGDTPTHALAMHVFGDPDTPPAEWFSA